MPAIASLQCARCHHSVPAKTPQTVCPLCARPLHVRYDIESLQRTAKREELGNAALPGMWRYASVLPEAAPVTLGEGGTPLLPSKRYPGLFVKDEGRNPTSSVQARGVAMAVTMAKHHGLRHLAVAGDGDAAGALAAYAARAGIAAHVFMPQDGPLASYLECHVYGAEVMTVNGPVAECAQRLEERIKGQRDAGLPPDELWFDVSEGKEPYRIEGEKTIGYELVEQLGWTYPDAILCPANAGVLGIEKALEEMEQLGWLSGSRPKMYVTQAQDGGSVFESGQQFEGELVVATEEKALQSLLDWARHEGIFLSPQGTTAAAAYGALLASGRLQPADKVVLINPGAGLKDADVTARTMKLKRPGALPTSAKVGGIITPV